MITSLRASLDAASQLAAQRQETIEYLKKQLYGVFSEKRKRPKEPQADGQLTLFDMYAQIFDEAEYHHDPKGKQDDLSDPAVQAVQYCDKLFMHERYCKEHGYSFEQRKEYRLKKSKPAIDSFFEWLEKQHPVVNSRLDKAVKYAQNRKPYLYTYLEDGRCSLSNNLSENAICPFTVGRRNWLFCATPEGANASAVAYTEVINTCKNKIK